MSREYDHAAAAQLRHYLEREGFIAHQVPEKEEKTASDPENHQLPKTDWVTPAVLAARSRHESIALLQKYTPEIQGLIAAFQRKLEYAIRQQNLESVLLAWQEMTSEVQARRQINKIALSNRFEKRQKPPMSQEDIFMMTAEKIFGQGKLESIYDKPTISTLQGLLKIGGAEIIPWPVKQRLLTWLNQPRQADGRLDHSLEDDYLHLNHEGMVFHSPDLGVDRKEYAWSQIDSLVLESNTGAPLDRVNRWRRWFPWWRQTFWQPFGILKVTDRNDGQELAKIMMGQPEQYAGKIRALGRIMNEGKTPSTKENPVQEIEIEDVLHQLPATLKAQLFSLLVPRSQSLKDTLIADGYTPLHEAFSPESKQDSE